MSGVTKPPDRWTGAIAARLQAALRLSNEDLAHQLGISPRTVAMWHAQPDRQPRPELQRGLDTVLDKATADAKARFDATGPAAHSAAPGLHVNCCGDTAGAGAAR